MPTALRLLFLYFWNWNGSPFLISLKKDSQEQISISFWFAWTFGPLYKSPLYDLKMPYPHGNSGKRTLAYSATKLFNELSSDLREFSTSSSPPTFKFIPSSHKSKLRNLFLLRLSSARSTWRIYCVRFAAFLFIVNVLHGANHIPCRVFCIFHSLLSIYILQFYYVLKVYSTLNIVSLAYILKSIFEGRKLENCDRLLRLPF